ncbi:MAG TPA: VgrG-related protein [Acidimicrobiales bacterium]|nr:VgrG-related protein [Acidimicrobiales bacterium]
MSMLSGVNSVQAYVEIDGAPLDPIVAAYLIEAEVDSSLFLPDQAKLVFQGGPDLILAGGLITIGVLLNVQVETGEVPMPIFNGEVTAIDLDYSPAGSRTIVRGLDLSHRLMKGTATRALPDMVASEAVAAVLAEAGVIPGEIIPTTTPYSQLNQANVSDWVFIRQLAELEGYDAYMDGLGLFNFCPAGVAEEGAPPVVSYEEPSLTGTQLVLGKNLIRLKASVTGADQVGAVQVRGWDPIAGIEVIGEAPALTTAVQSEDPLVEPAAIGEMLGGVQFVVTDRSYPNEDAAETRAIAVASQIASSSIEMYGECYGSPSIIAGASVSIGMAGLPFDGMYVVSEAKHRFVPGSTGYTTWFTIGGRRNRSLLALSNPGGGGDGTHAVRPTIPGVVIGEVVDADDPLDLGRVKLRFGWLDDLYVSDFARVRQDHVSEGSGCMWIPEVGTEVLVAFDRGDINFPYVLGCLYSATFPPVPPPDVEGMVNERRIQSRMRHMLWFQDGEEAQGITLITGEEDCLIRIDAMEQQIQIVSAGMINIEAAAELSITAGGDISISTEGALTLEGGEVAINGDSLNLSGEGDVTVTAEGAVAVAGSVIMLGEG